MNISKEQLMRLPKEFHKYFVKKGGDASSDEVVRKNIHPT